MILRTGNSSDDETGEASLLVLFRHGVAELADGRPDEQRALTAEGVAEVRLVSRGLRRLLPRVDAIYSSPLLRCTQTASRIEKAYAGEVPLAVSPHLRPEATTREFLKFIESTTHRRAIMVGHEPNLSDWMMALTKTKGSFELKKAGIYVIRIDAGVARLEWCLSPKLFRKLRKGF